MTKVWVALRTITPPVLPLNSSVFSTSSQFALSSSALSLATVARPSVLGSTVDASPSLGHDRTGQPDRLSGQFLVSTLALLPWAIFDRSLLFSWGVGEGELFSSLAK